MYKFISHQLNDSQSKFYFVVGNNNQNCREFDEVNYSLFVHLLKSENKDFLKVFCESLNNATDEFSAYFWECIPVSQRTINKKFEFVVTKSEALNKTTQDSSSFAEHLAKLNAYRDSFISFPNKNKDAVLVIPAFVAGKTKALDYKNISQFTKNAPLKQQSKFWQEVAHQLEARLEDGAPCWLSTHGLGVPFLHVQIDDKPKYYTFEEYKTEKEQQKNKKDNINSGKKFTNDDQTKISQFSSSSSIDTKKRWKGEANQFPQSPNRLILWISCGIGAILVIGIGLVIWWKQKKDKTNQK